MSNQSQNSRKYSNKNGNTNSMSFGANGSSTPPATGESATTGRYLVLFHEDAAESGMRMLSQQVGINTASLSEFEGNAIPTEMFTGDESFFFERLGVAVVAARPDQFQALNSAAADGNEIQIIEEERYVQAIERIPTVMAHMNPGRNGGVSTSSLALPTYLHGYQTAVNHLVGQLLNGQSVQEEMNDLSVGTLDETELTWGLQATNVAESRFTGRGVRIAVLDTGFDFGHPDFVGRQIISQSFIAGESADDVLGHGTHVIGTACGPKQPGQLPRYGIASDAEIFVGKVLNNQGSGRDGGILAGIEWAIANKCDIVSMSLGARTFVGQTFSRVFEAVARRALAAGTLIIAAAGNESRRPADIAPVSHPANCPSILAVGAIDSALQVATFSTGGLNLQGGQVDIAGPGVAVRSSWPRPTLYRTISGTSMATPHVAGIAALHAEANPAMRGGSLGWLLLQSARRLDLPNRDAGAGLVQAP